MNAAGARVAYQSAHYPDTSPLNETVFFDHTDASGMTRRTATRTGFVFSGDGGEGSPVEADPMGGNAGTSTPYIELLPPYEPPQDYPMLMPLFNSDMPYVNGQRVTCTLDGFAIGCSQAQNMMQNGSAIPAALAAYQHRPGFSFMSHGLGIYSYSYTVPGNNNAPTPPNGDPSAAYGTQDRIVTGSFSIPNFNVSWGPRGLAPDETPQEAVDNAITEAAKQTAGDKCRTAIEGLLRKAFMEKLKADKVDYNKLSAEERAEIDNFLEKELTAAKIVGAVKNASKVYAPDDLRLSGGDGHDSATTTHSGGKVTVSFYGGFFNQIMSGKSDIVSQIGPATPPRPYKGNSTSLQERAHSIIHEGIHAIYPGFTDGFIGRIIKNKKKDLGRDEGSKAINDFVKDNCK